MLYLYIEVKERVVVKQLSNEGSSFVGELKFGSLRFRDKYNRRDSYTRYCSRVHYRRENIV